MTLPPAKKLPWSVMVTGFIAAASEKIKLAAANVAIKNFFVNAITLPKKISVDLNQFVLRIAHVEFAHCL